mgnify:CR=1 FL=1
MARLRYEVVGEGPPVVLLNGLFQRLESWDPVLPHLQGFALLRYDMRGQGESEAPEGAYTPGVHAEDLLGLLDRLGFSWIMTSEKLWGDFPTLPAGSVYELIKDGNVVTPVWFIWDGQRLAAEDEATPGDSGDGGA